MSKEELLQAQLFLISSLEKPFASSATMWGGSAGHEEGNPYSLLLERISQVANTALLFSR